jgi:hypothetical protein
MPESPRTPGRPHPKIGKLNEKRLHSALKQWYAEPGDQLEVPVEGYVIDIVRGDLLVEIQTRNFASIKAKVIALTNDYAMRLVYPAVGEKWLLKLPPDGAGRAKRRKSPRRGSFEDVFSELVSFPELLASPNLSLEILLVHEEEVRRHDPRRRWRRRGWVTEERHLLAVVERRLFETPEDISALLPPELPEPFTTSDLASAIGRPRRLAQRMAYCLRKMHVIERVGKRSRAFLYARSTPA